METHFGDRTSARQAARRVADEQSPSGDFFANPVTTALAALALQAAAPGTAAARRCAEYLLTSQLPDGTWRFSTSDVWDTSLTVRAFHGAPAFDRHGLPAAVAFLVAAQNPDGGWPYRLGVESDNDTTAAVLIALDGASGAPGTTIRAGLRHLVRQQTADGLWRTWQSAGDPPVDDVVAHVVTALARHSGRHAHTWPRRVAGSPNASANRDAGTPGGTAGCRTPLPRSFLPSTRQYTREAAPRRPDSGRNP